MASVLNNVVVVGGGLAGARCVDELRAQRFGGNLTLIAAEDEDPYDRPPLSKGFLTGACTPELRLPCDLTGATILRAHRAIGLTDHGVDTDQGSVAADAVVIATGADPIRLPGPGPQHVLRTRADALYLRNALAACPRLVVIGASWIGAEVAGAALALGCSVTCIEAGPAPLHQALGRQLGERTLPWWSDVDLRLSRHVVSIDHGGVRLSDGATLEADLVLTAVGVRPAVTWLADSDVPLDRGVLVDHRMIADLSADHPWYGRLAAVGDAAAWTSDRYCTRMRVEHWDDARLGPRTAVAALLGDREARHDPVPYFWSQQFGHRIQYVGHHQASDRLILREPADGWAAAWLSPEGVLRAYLSVDRPRDIAAARRLIETGARLDPRRLGDPLSALDEGPA